MFTINDLKIGSLIKINNEPYEVIYTQHVQMGRGGAILRTKIKNLLTGHVFERTYQAGDKFETADLNKSKVSFLYEEYNKYYFMDNQTFEQFFFTKEHLQTKVHFLKEGQVAEVLYFEDNPVNITLPPKIDLKVISTAEAIRGDTVSGNVTKEAITETGYILKVPLFIKEGDVVKVNTESGDYVERVIENKQ